MIFGGEGFDDAEQNLLSLDVGMDHINNNNDNYNDNNNDNYNNNDNDNDGGGADDGDGGDDVLQNVVTGFDV